jgi:hypothetical protein
MSSFKLVGAMALLSVATALPAMAQPVISEPGYCAFFYPNANCQNKGPGNPYTDPNYRRDVIQPGVTVGVAPKRARAHRTHAAAVRLR